MPPSSTEPILRRRVPARIDQVEVLRQAMLGALTPFEPSPRAVYRLELVLEEVFVNIVRHAFGGDAAAHAVDVSLTVDGAHWVLAFEDDGRAFDPTRHSALPSGPLSALEPGGRGLHLVQKTAQDMRYRRDGALNRLQVSIDR